MHRVLRSVVLPVSAPVFVVTLIWQLTSAWDNVLFALVLTNRDNGLGRYFISGLMSGSVK